MKFIKKNLSNILFIVFIIFLFTPYGLPLRATFIKGVSFVTTRVFSLKIDKNDRVKINNTHWKLVDLNGNSINFQDFEKQVIIVNYWATWCPPCVAEMPSFQNLYNDYKDEVVFIFLANDEKARVEKFIKKNSYTIPIYFQITQGPQEMQSNSLPTTYIINKEGEIVVNKTGAVDWNSGKVRDLLDDLIQE
ncbi:MAG: TlpA family protein disulfide reductase [Flavobacteriaceae bacterium]|nr:TlpA family protein disulfide reductase [Flavobacteriaceae bacterium]